MGRALLVTEPGVPGPRAALEARGWEVEVCPPDRARQALTGDVELVACQLAYSDGAYGSRLLAGLLKQRPDVGAFLFGDHLDPGIERALLEGPEVPVIRTPASPKLVTLAADGARTLPH